MKFVNYSSLKSREKRLMKKAFEAAKRSVTSAKHEVGCAILDNEGNIFLGATNARSRAIGSTCAERMAMDQLYFQRGGAPIFLALVGRFNRKGWKESYICTPCGVCLEMFSEVMRDFQKRDFNFICPAWNKSKILKVSLSELYPQIGKGDWERL